MIYKITIVVFSQHGVFLCVWDKIKLYCEWMNGWIDQKDMQIVIVKNINCLCMYYKTISFTLHVIIE